MGISYPPSHLALNSVSKRIQKILPSLRNTLVREHLESTVESKHLCKLEIMMGNDAIKKGFLISLEMMSLQVAEPKWQHLVRDMVDMFS